MTDPLLQVAALPGYGNGYAARARPDPAYSAMPEAAQGHESPGTFLPPVFVPIEVFAARLADLDLEVTQQVTIINNTSREWPPACWPEFVNRNRKPQ